MAARFHAAGRLQLRALSRPSLQVKAAVGATSECLASYALSDFSSKAGMELAGWFFNWDDEGVFKPAVDVGNGYQMTDYIPHGSYWGSCRLGDGALSLVLKGQGQLTLDYGNPFGDPTGNVTVYLNGIVQSVAPVYTFSKRVELSFSDGDWMEVKEVSGVIAVNSLIFNCDAAPTTSAMPGEAGDGMDDATRHGIEESQKNWGTAYVQHQEDSLRVERQQAIYNKVLKLKDETNGSRASPSHHVASERGGPTLKEKLSKAAEVQERFTKEDLEEAKEAARNSERKEKEMALLARQKLEQAHRVVRKDAAEEGPDPTSLYCYSVTMPAGYEPGLLAAQEQRGVGIFACDEHAVFSNTTVDAETGGPLPISITALHMSLAVKLGGKWHTALNTDIFNHIWTKIVELGRYRRHDWTVKVDADSVFFPGRLRKILQHNIPLSAVGQRRLAPKRGTCGDCRRQSHSKYSCEDSVRWLQQKGHSCSEALRLVARPPPVDCGCQCNAVEACDVRNNTDLWEDGREVKGRADPEAIYINNCRFGLHGPIEVLSQKAVTAYVRGLKEKKCTNLDVHPWGEDKYLDRCMLEIGVTRVNQFSLLSEIACGETPAPCGGADVAFHPFKTVEGYFACWSYADRTGL